MTAPKARRTASGKRPHMKGVSVETREGARGTTYVARYTLGDGSRLSVKPRIPFPDWDTAFNAAAEEQRRVDRNRGVAHGMRQQTFEQLVTDHYMPTLHDKAVGTKKTVRSHLGDGTGQPKKMGRKNTLGARFALRFYFGDYQLCDFPRAAVLQWQNEMITAGYEVSSIKAKRSLLKQILKIAVVNNWMDVNYVDTIPEPRERPNDDDDKSLSPEDWAHLRSRMAGEVTRLYAETLLDSGIRRGEAIGLRAMDVISPTDDEPTQHLYIRRKVIWPGKELVKEETGQDQYWMVEEFPKGRKWRRVPISPHVHRRLVAHIDRFKLLPTDFVFDYGLMRVEHAVKRQAAPLPSSFPSGRYINDQGRSGEHGRYTTYGLGCRCPFCRNAYSEYRFWWARGRGRQSATPWLEDGYLESRPGNTEPLDPSWYDRCVWKPAIKQCGFDWTPTPHDLRHAMVTWASEADVPLHVIQADAGHANQRTTEAYKHRIKKVRPDRIVAMETMYDRVEAADPNSTPPAPAAVEPAAPAAVDNPMAAMVAAMTPEQLTAVMMQMAQGQQPPSLRVVGD